MPKLLLPAVQQAIEGLLLPAVQGVREISPEELLLPAVQQVQSTILDEVSKIAPGQPGDILEPPLDQSTGSDDIFGI